MTLLHQAAQKAVEAMTEEERSDLSVGACVFRCPPYDKNPQSQRIADLMERLGATPPALQQQPEPVAWYWEHVMQGSHGVIEAGFSGSTVEVTDNAMWDGKVATIVTELHAGRRLLPPKIAADMGLPTELPALQHQEVPLTEFVYCVECGDGITQHDPGICGCCYAIKCGGGQEVPREPVADERILHIWDTHVGSVSETWPLSDKDKLRFARAVLYAAASSSTTRQQEAGSLGAFLTKLPTLDPSWPEAVQDGWMRCFNSLRALAAAPSTPENAGGVKEGVAVVAPADPFTVSAALRRLIADDAYAMTFQTFGQYRTALLKAIDAATVAAGIPLPDPHPKAPSGTGGGEHG